MQTSWIGSHSELQVAILKLWGGGGGGGDDPWA